MFTIRVYGILLNELNQVLVSDEKNPTQQIISIYYYAKALEPIAVPLRLTPFEFDEEQHKLYETTQEIESFRFIDWDQFGEDAVHLPIDNVVAKLLKNGSSAV